MKILSLFVFAILLAACSKPKVKSDVTELNMEQDSIKLIADKLGAQVWFSEDFTTTYEYQQYLHANNKLLITRFTIVDIVDLDSIFMLTIEADYSPTIFIELVCTKDKISDILNRLGEQGYKLQLISLYSAVVEITSIEKVKYGIVSSIEDDSYESEDGETYIPSQYVCLSLDVSDSFICKGKLLELYPNLSN